MDTLDTPVNSDHPSTLGDRQASQASTTPLLNSIPSIEDQISSNKSASNNENVASGSLNSNNCTQADQNAEHTTFSVDGNQTVQVVIDSNNIESKNGSTLQNGTEPGRQPADQGDLRERGTTIPIREEFRCRRFWFFYHDLRALTTSCDQRRYWLSVYWLWNSLKCLGKEEKIYKRHN